MNDYTELLIRTLCDVRPEFSVGGAYVYCQTQDNQQSLFQTVHFLLKGSLVSKILILQTEAKSGYPGFSKWRHQLRETGLTDEQIEGVTIGDKAMIHTLIESEALIRFAKQKRYRSLLVVAPPFQQLRAFMTAVTVALRKYPELLLYSYPAVAMPWQDTVMHSQGSLKATRSELIQIELERIYTYQIKGDLASFADVSAYLDNRQILSRKLEGVE
jgi:hypothetical protein